MISLFLQWIKEYDWEGVFGKRFLFLHSAHQSNKPNHNVFLHS